MDDNKRYRIAGLAYFVLAMAIIGMTVANPAMAAPERREDLIHALVGLPFIALFAALIAWGDRVLAAPMRWFGASAERAAQLGIRARELLVMILTVSNFGRFLIYALSTVGWRLRLRPWPEIESAAANPKMLINATLMAVIVFLLARASWVPFLQRRRA